MVGRAALVSTNQLSQCTRLSLSLTSYFWYQLLAKLESLLYRHGIVIILNQAKEVEKTAVWIWKKWEEGDRQSCQLVLPCKVMEMGQT